MSGHTPGPYTVFWDMGDGDYHWIIGPGGDNHHRLAKVEMFAPAQTINLDADPEAIGVANAHLFSAADDLYRALKAADEILVATFAQVSNPEDRHGWTDDDAWQQHQRNLAAIAKAEGDNQ